MRAKQNMYLRSLVLYEVRLQSKQHVIVRRCLFYNTRIAGQSEIDRVSIFIMHFALLPTPDSALSSATLRGRIEPRPALRALRSPMGFPMQNFYHEARVLLAPTLTVEKDAGWLRRATMWNSLIPCKHPIIGGTTTTGV